MATRGPSDSSVQGADVISQRQLAIQIVAGASQPDPFRMHGAIVAALERYPPADALANIFTPALQIATTAHGLTCRGAIATAIRAHIALLAAGEHDDPTT